jgi:NADH:ubiquinone oxidoreductase subunit K
LSLLLLGIGLYCMMSRRRVIKQVIGLSIMLQGALLILLDAGLAHDALRQVQGMLISALVVEAIVLAIALTLIVNVFRFHPKGLVDDLDQLKG